MVWEITASGTYKDLHDFGGTVVNAGGTSGPDGYIPNAGVTFDSAGNMYGTTTSGGPNDSGWDYGGVLWEITAAGAYKDLHDFGGGVINADGANGPDGSYLIAGVTVNSAGNLHGTTSYGGANAITDGMVWEMTAAGVYKDLHDFGGTVTNADGASGPDGTQSEAQVVFDSAGNMYGTTGLGGPDELIIPGFENDFGGNTWEITASGTYKDLHDFGGTVTNADGTSGPDGNTPLADVTFDSAGNMYGSASEGGPNGNTVNGTGGDLGVGAGMAWEITTAGTYEDLHDFGGGLVGGGPRDGVLPDEGVVFDSAGNMFGTTYFGGTYGGSFGDGTIWQITADGVYRRWYNFSATDGDNNPIAAVTFDSAGNMYGTTFEGGANGEGVVWKINAAP